MTFEQFLVQALGLLDKLRQRGVNVYYRAGLINAGEESFIVRADLDGQIVEIELSSESYVESYAEALVKLQQAVDFIEVRDATVSRVKDMLTSLPLQELLALQSDAVRQHIASTIHVKRICLPVSQS
jgi:hypothetical protein